MRDLLGRKVATPMGDGIVEIAHEVTKQFIVRLPNEKLLHTFGWEACTLYCLSGHLGCEYDDA